MLGVISAGSVLSEDSLGMVIPIDRFKRPEKTLSQAWDRQVRGSKTTVPTGPKNWKTMSIPTIGFGVNNFEPEPSGRTIELDDLPSFLRLLVM